MNENFIDVEIAKEFAEKEYYPCIEGYVETKVIKDFLDSCPRSEAKPIIEAHWIKEDDGKYYCNNCGYPAEGNISEYAEWCPVCGAQIDGEAENG